MVLGVGIASCAPSYPREYHFNALPVPLLTPRFLKIYVFPLVFKGFLVPWGSQDGCPTWIDLRVVLGGVLGGVLEGFRAVLGPSWGRLGSLGASWERLGAVLRCLGDVLGCISLLIQFESDFLSILTAKMDPQNLQKSLHFIGFTVSASFSPFLS